MNGNYYQNPTFPTNQNNMQNMTVPPGNVSSMEDYNEQSYIENILRLNKGRKVNAYVSFPDSTEWKNKIFSGLILTVFSIYSKAFESGLANPILYVKKI